MSEYRVRRATADEIPEVLSVCSAALGWTDTDFDSALFRWKHLDNAFGPSLLLVAESGAGIVGVRPMMRWRFRRGDEVIAAARPVDTATHPSAQGQGLFTRLTSAALDELSGSTAMAFNTPNEKSRPGYLKLGWQEDGRVPFGVRASGLGGAMTAGRNRGAATKKSVSTPTLGIQVETAIRERFDPRLGSDRSSWATDHTVDTMLWRYARGPVVYRAILVEDAALIVRVRMRGAATELVVASVLGLAGGARLRRALGETMDEVGASHAITPLSFPGSLRVPFAGPNVTTRAIPKGVVASPIRWTPGDIELF